MQGTSSRKTAAVTAVAVVSDCYRGWPFQSESTRPENYHKKVQVARSMWLVILIALQGGLTAVMMRLLRAGTWVAGFRGWCSTPLI